MSSLLVHRDGTRLSSVFFLVFLQIAEVAVGSASVEIRLQREPEGFYTAALDVADHPMRVLLDTGSRDFWVSQASNPHSKVPGLATWSTFGGIQHVLMPGSPFHVEYGSDSVAGTVQSGLVKLPAKSGDPVSMTCEYGLALQRTGSLLNRSVDGVWGLAPGGSMESLVHCLYRQKLIQHRIVSLHLAEHSGLMRFGGSPNWWTARLAVVGVDQSWAVELNGISLHSSNSSSRTLQSVTDKRTQVFLDSGSQGLRGPAAGIKALAQAIGADQSGPGGHPRVLCSRLSSVPDLVLQLPMLAHRQLHKTDILTRLHLTSSQSRGTTLGIVLPARSLVGNSTGKWCTLQLRSTGVRGQWVMGEVFFRKMHAVAFDFVTQGIVIDPLEHAAVLVDSIQPQPEIRKHHRTLLSTEALTETF